MPAIETEQHAGRAGDPRFVDEETDVDRHRALIGRIEVGHGVQAVSVAAEAQCLWLTAADTHNLYKRHKIYFLP